MSTLNLFVRREIQKRSETINGTVIKAPTLKAFNAAGAAPVWVVDVNINSRDEPLRNVLVKAGANGSRFYADLNQVVLLRRNMLERFQVIGPGDRAAIAMPVIKTYTIGNLNPNTTANFGQRVVILPYSVYKGDLPGTPNSGEYGVGNLGYPARQIIDNATGLPI